MINSGGAPRLLLNFTLAGGFRTGILSLDLDTVTLGLVFTDLFWTFGRFFEMDIGSYKLSLDLVLVFLVRILVNNESKIIVNPLIKKSKTTLFLYGIFTRTNRKVDLLSLRNTRN